jgi:hypothetical protein
LLAFLWPSSLGLSLVCVCMCVCVCALHKFMSYVCVHVSLCCQRKDYCRHTQILLGTLSEEEGFSWIKGKGHIGRNKEPEASGC